MYRIPNAPSPRAAAHEMADFIEWCTWRDGMCSARATNTVLDQLDDNFDNEGCDDNSDTTAAELDEVFQELERRSVSCGGGYPFVLDRIGSVLKKVHDISDPRYLLYFYLLMSTRLNMKDDKIHAGIDGTQLLEHLAAHVIRNYLGANRAMAQVFGTAESGLFEEKVNALCRDLGEGGGFRHWDQGQIYANDARLDAVGWIPFSDGLAGKLSVFLQCKTGSTWQQSLGNLNPEAFLQTWTMHRRASIHPIKGFCVAEASPKSRWTELTSLGGLFFDRCRIVDFSENMDSGLFKTIQKWTQAAFDVNVGKIAAVVTAPKKRGSSATKHGTKRKNAKSKN